MAQRVNLTGMKLKEMFLLLKESADNGVENVIAADIQRTSSITKSEAYRRYGRTNVDRWLQEGLLNPAMAADEPSPNRIDRKKLEAIAASSNRGTYLPVAER
jgi:hypothetical protein